MSDSLYDARLAGALCDKCPLDGSTVVPPEGPVSSVPQLVLIADSPSSFEVENERPMQGMAGVKLNEFLGACGVQRKDTLLTFGILCRAVVPNLIGKKAFVVKNYLTWLTAENKRRKKAKEPLLESPFACCAPRLQRELEAAERLCREAGFANGAVVMPLAGHALGSALGVPGKSLSIVKYRGSVIDESAAGEMAVRLRGKTK